MPAATTEQVYDLFKRQSRVCTDTRNIIPGSIFFALKGANFNGNSFAADAIKQGAAFAVIDEAAYDTGDHCLLVPDVLTALQDIARLHRRYTKIPVIAITGSNGKTTTKELVAAVLSKKFKTLFTQGNLNNHIGVPLTLLRITVADEMAVIEMGANHQQEIALLCSIAEPDSGMITNAGLAHLEGFGGPEGVLKGKTELFDFLRTKTGTAFVLSDDPRLTERAKGIQKIITYGVKNEAQVRGTLIAADPFVRFRWSSPGISTREVATQMVGDYNLPNMLAAISCGLEYGVSPEDIDAAVAGYIPDMNRSQVIRRGSNTIIMDAYNANPSSMTAALRNFAGMAGEHKLVILGDMLELGQDEKSLHQQIVNQLSELQLKNVLLVGSIFSGCSLSPGTVFVNDSGKATTWLKENPPQNSLVLVKGSRGTKLEKVLDAL
ncbi:MAG: UDP-N-acetylmuramoyl-tripeptide--D-alanyl-D-alanine ligase [Bacteroidetes bacterium]|nr:MAG: UDP-N-acetylmuramoyl-tripeptide--D-alanyl-D-alanine ligase [Bacteroidota bacterium]